MSSAVNDQSARLWANTLLLWRTNRSCDGVRFKILRSLLPLSPIQCGVCMWVCWGCSYCKKAKTPKYEGFLLHGA